MITLNQLNQERDKGDSPIDGSNSKVVSGVWEKAVEGARRFSCFDSLTGELQVG